MQLFELQSFQPSGHERQPVDQQESHHPERQRPWRQRVYGAAHLSGRIAAVERKNRACEKRGAVAGQEGDEAGSLICRRNPAERMLTPQVIDKCIRIGRLAGRAVQDGRVDGAQGDRVHSDAAGGKQFGCGGNYRSGQCVTGNKPARQSSDGEPRSGCGRAVRLRYSD